MGLATIPRQRLFELLRAMPKAEPASAHRRHARARADLRAGAEERRRARLPGRGGAARCLRLQRLAELPRHLLRRRRACCCERLATWTMADNMAYFRRAAADDVVHAEVFLRPADAQAARGVPIGAVIEGLAAARVRAPARARPVESSFLDPAMLPAPSQRRRGDGHARGCAAVPRALHRCRSRQQRARSHPPEKFARVFARAGELGLHCVAASPARKGRRPTSRSALLDVLHAERIDHGVRSIEDPALVRRLARAKASRSPSARCRI